MADVAERAQVLLMAALGMAILFVALALILNTAIYTENLATRGSEIAGGGDAIRYVDGVRDGIGGSISYVNRYNYSSHETLQRNLTEAVSLWTNASSRQFAHRGRSVDVSLDGTVNGTRIAQDDSSRVFTDNGGNESWTLAEDVSGTREFRIYVPSTGELVDWVDLDSNDPFEVTVTDGSETWRLNVTQELSDVIVGVHSTTGVDATCDSESNSAWINVTEGTVTGTECPELRFAEGVEPPYVISFNHANRIEGTYTVIVDNATVAADPAPHLNDDGTNPYAEHAIYSAGLVVEYQTPRLYWNSTLRVAPGETDD